MRLLLDLAVAVQHLELLELPLLAALAFDLGPLGQERRDRALLLEPTVPLLVRQRSVVSAPELELRSRHPGAGERRRHARVLVTRRRQRLRTATDPGALCVP